MAIVTLPPDREEQFLGAAISCFARYGYQRTSMGAIAQAADISRPALYQYFTSKNDIFRAAVDWQLARIAEEAERQSERPGSPDNRLGAVLALVIGLHRPPAQPGGPDHNPFHGEMVDETYARAGDLWDSFESRMIAALRSVLHRHESELDFAATAMTPDDVARVLFNGTKGIAAHTPSQREARRQMARLVGLTVRALSPAR
ncbi:TetR/AcrR family transcriptional regulator [Gordonia terrae]|uniref:TetR/AcrR family transcriptional regulator n=1 Tax=Gordonia terrae TaxID=2055 RepID=UPI002009DE1B|nr:TetR/AcrR family transcriptional regulator [Gordonia terrae]UPW08601.1 TetR/AcrR family transcriptional regulator [Gordonia terrae]